MARGLLDIPREVRDKIYDEVLQSLLPAPEYSKEDDSDPAAQRELLADVDYHGYGHGKRIEWQTRSSAVPHPFTQLLLVNRQVRAEALDARRRAGKVVVVADIMLADEAKLLPTILSAPPPPPPPQQQQQQHFDVVRAQVRVVGLAPPESFPSNEDPTSTGRANDALWRRRGGAIWHGGGDSDMPAATWMFYDLLQRFLKVGPRLRQGPDRAQSSTVWERSVGGAVGGADESSSSSSSSSSSDPTDNRHITISTLQIDVLSPADPSLLAPADGSATGSWSWLMLRMLGPRPGSFTAEEAAQQMLQMRPEWLARWLASHIDRLLCMDFRTMEWGALLFERVGRIRVTVDGRAVDKPGTVPGMQGRPGKQQQQLGEFDLARHIHRIPVPKNAGANPFGYYLRVERAEWFERWKANVVEQRRRDGLGVAEDAGEEEPVKMRTISNGL